jgi:hypothetical protein
MHIPYICFLCDSFLTFGVAWMQRTLQMQMTGAGNVQKRQMKCATLLMGADAYGTDGNSTMGDTMIE